MNFDGKLLQELGGTEKVNRLAVVAVQEEENLLLCVTKTEDSTGKVEADAEKEAINFLKESLPAVLILLHLTVGSTVEVVFYFNSSSTDSCSG